MPGAVGAQQPALALGGRKRLRAHYCAPVRQPPPNGAGHRPFRPASDHQLRCRTRSPSHRHDGRALAGEYLELADDRSKVLVLSTPSDTRADALRCGKVLSTILLECTMAGMATCTLTHLIESSDSRDIVRGLTRQRGEPQALIRVGIAPPLAAVPAPTPRRPLDSVLQIRQTPEKGRNASDRNARETGWFSPP